MNYYVSDLHFDHANAIKYDKRPYTAVEEMNSRMIENWNRVVTEEDTVYVLGDLTMHGTAEKIDAIISKLQGHVVVIRGNHDCFEVTDITSKKILVRDYMELTDTIGENQPYHVVLSHYPMFAWNRMLEGSILLYGHTHLMKEDSYYQRFLRDYEAMKKDENGNIGEVMAINVGCMQPWIQYTPRTLTEIVNGYRKMRENG